MQARQNDEQVTRGFFPSYHHHHLPPAVSTVGMHSSQLFPHLSANNSHRATAASLDAAFTSGGSQADTQPRFQELCPSDNLGFWLSGASFLRGGDISCGPGGSYRGKAILSKLKNLQTVGEVGSVKAWISTLTDPHGLTLPIEHPSPAMECEGGHREPGRGATCVKPVIPLEWLRHSKRPRCVRAEEIELRMSTALRPKVQAGVPLP
ncbi:hypothetical protein B0H14DRAFT_3579840 [Mycena olivaceomarginata]|nr:hypothetical protein B0H14DRAFT_3579840 [Mycena olivaceomarginata]